MMKISKRKTQEIANVIYDEVVELRVELAVSEEPINKAQLDHRLFLLEDKIWEKLVEVLGIE